ncbi:MAG: NGG1p interacting factor NIF3 [Pseudohongiellaceae bacterium]
MDGSLLIKIEFYVPESHLESVKAAMFGAGAGKVGAYESCAWQTLGQGQFRPIEGSSPFIGEVNTLEKVIEYKVEMVCEQTLVDAVVAAMKKHHPYEEVAYFLFDGLAAL